VLTARRSRRRRPPHVRRAPSGRCAWAAAGKAGHGDIFGARGAEPGVGGALTTTRGRAIARRGVAPRQHLRSAMRPSQPASTSYYRGSLRGSGPVVFLCPPRLLNVAVIFPYRSAVPISPPVNHRVPHGEHARPAIPGRHAGFSPPTKSPATGWARKRGRRPVSGCAIRRAPAPCRGGAGVRVSPFRWTRIAKYRRIPAFTSGGGGTVGHSRHDRSNSGAPGRPAIRRRRSRHRSPARPGPVRSAARRRRRAPRRDGRCRCSAGRSTARPARPDARSRHCRHPGRRTAGTGRPTRAPGR
jgi:hypothetical protein